jgi:hypothetical protein
MSNHRYDGFPIRQKIVNSNNPFPVPNNQFYLSNQDDFGFINYYKGFQHTCIGILLGISKNVYINIQLFFAPCAIQFFISWMLQMSSDPVGGIGCDTETNCEYNRLELGL